MSKKQLFRVIDEELELDEIYTLKQLRHLANEVVKMWHLSREEKKEFGLYYDNRRKICDCIEIIKNDNTKVIIL